jgi:hypothetical protein
VNVVHEGLRDALHIYGYLTLDHLAFRLQVIAASIVAAGWPRQPVKLEELKTHLGQGHGCLPSMSARLPLAISLYQRHLLLAGTLDTNRTRSAGPPSISMPQNRTCECAGVPALLGRLSDGVWIDHGGHRCRPKRRAWRGRRLYSKNILIHRRAERRIAMGWM